jgi:hypothetical protein
MARSTCNMKGEGILDELAKVLKPTNADLEWAGKQIKAGILDRTQRGVDYQGNRFAPYSRKGPYYYYPNGSGGRTKAEKASNIKRVKRMAGRLRDGRVTRSGHGIRFDSYAAYKASMGRNGTVDLRGPSDPHMLQAIVVRVQGGQCYVGIYDTFAADKASGHNDGLNRHLPQRQFFEASDDDIAVIAEDLQERLIARADNYIRK